MAFQEAQASSRIAVPQAHSTVQRACEDKALIGAPCQAPGGVFVVVENTQRTSRLRVPKPHLIIHSSGESVFSIRTKRASGYGSLVSEVNNPLCTGPAHGRCLGKPQLG